MKLWQYINSKGTISRAAKTSDWSDRFVARIRL